MLNELKKNRMLKKLLLLLGSQISKCDSFEFLVNIK